MSNETIYALVELILAAPLAAGVGLWGLTLIKGIFTK